MEPRLEVALGENLRAYRRVHGLTQEELAESLGSHRTYIGSIERGERNLSLAAIQRLAHDLHLTPLALLTPGSIEYEPHAAD